MKEIKILIADNSKRQQKLYSNFFREINKNSHDNYTFALEFAENGKEALKKIIDDGFDFLICEEFLTKLKGIELLKELQLKNHIIPSVLITKKGSEELAVTAFRTGFLNYWRKENLNLNDLLRDINKSLNLKSNGDLHKFEYQELIPGQEYHLAFLKFDLLRGKNSIATLHSRDKLDQIYKSIRDFFERKVKNLGGEIWASKSESFLAVFHRTNFIKNAVICSIDIFSGLCLYNLSTNSSINAGIGFKLGVHHGLARFENNKDIIISKDINYTAHMLKKSDDYTFIISEDIYNVLDEKLTIHFKESFEFKKKKIYHYLF